jgi:hypothetical protein
MLAGLPAPRNFLIVSSVVRSSFTRTFSPRRQASAKHQTRLHKNFYGSGDTAVSFREVLGLRIARFHRLVASRCDSSKIVPENLSDVNRNRHEWRPFIMRTVYVKPLSQSHGSAERVSASLYFLSDAFLCTPGERRSQTCLSRLAPPEG